MVTAHDLKENATVVVVGYGIDASVCHQAERVVTTSKQQMYLTGTDFADAQGIMPEVTAELPALLAAQTPCGRRQALLSVTTAALSLQTSQ